MALMISDDCSACDACIDVCPNQAIGAGTPIYAIDPLRCTECVGAEDEPQCRLVCPVDCILQHPEHQESPDALRQKYVAMHPA